MIPTCLFIGGLPGIGGIVHGDLLVQVCTILFGKFAFHALSGCFVILPFWACV